MPRDPPAVVPPSTLAAPAVSVSSAAGAVSTGPHTAIVAQPGVVVQQPPVVAHHQLAAVPSASSATSSAIMVRVGMTSSGTAGTSSYGRPIVIRQWPRTGRQDGHPQAKLWKCCGSFYGSREEIVARLREGADVNYYGELLSWGSPAQDRFGYRKNFTVLHQSCIHGKVSVAQTLLELNALVEGATAVGVSAPTPLQAAVCWRQPNMVRLLLDHGASINPMWSKLEASLVHRSVDGALLGSVVAGMLFGSSERTALEFCDEEVRRLSSRTTSTSSSAMSADSNTKALRQWRDIQQSVAARVNGVTRFEYSQEDQASCVIC
mmetsp:Transcript_1373/g.3186  ORF Transcript_1373/g.3186 Transcript_1373/m.3186 type:complete len:320 (+) Transcript_1373:582-1541(+)